MSFSIYFILLIILILIYFHKNIYNFLIKNHNEYMIINKDYLNNFTTNSDNNTNQRKWLTSDGTLIIDGRRPHKDASIIDQDGNILWNPAYPQPIDNTLKPIKVIKTYDPNATNVIWIYNDRPGRINTNYVTKTASDLLFGKSLQK